MHPSAAVLYLTIPAFSWSSASYRLEGLSFLCRCPHRVLSYKCSYIQHGEWAQRGGNGDDVWLCARIHARPKRKPAAGRVAGVSCCRREHLCRSLYGRHVRASGVAAHGEQPRSWRPPRGGEHRSSGEKLCRHSRPVAPSHTRYRSRHHGSRYAPARHAAHARGGARGHGRAHIRHCFAAAQLRGTG